MSFSDDEEILQDFLLEVGEILELLSEQLVDLEQRPNDVELLNAIFRGFHTVKGGAGFLQFDTMVEACHVTENLFDVLRTGKRLVTTNLMDVVLKLLDSVNLQFQQISNLQAPEAVDPRIITALTKLVDGSDDNNQAEEVVQVAEEIVQADTVSIDESNNPANSSTENNDGEIKEDEFEALLDELHGKGKAPTSARKLNSKITDEKAKIIQGSKTPAKSTDISDSEFEDLLDELHGSGNAPGIATGSKSKKSPSDPDTISEDEFEELLDQLHGVGAKLDDERKSNEQLESKSTNVPQAEAAKKPVSENTATSKVVTELAAVSALAEENKKPIARQVKETISKSNNPATEKAKEAVGKEKLTPKSKTPVRSANDATVRVDTQRLDDIMNMVGELVLARNRLVRLGSTRNDDELNKALGMLDVVTGDLQSEVMKTRMQPIRKVFGRFPRVVRDLARSLNKEISLKLKGEDTDLDKNLVEALADPLIHLVRNAADHGIETPEERIRAGKNRVGTVILDARQEGDHILLSIHDDGAGIDPDLLRKKAIEKHVMDADTAARLTDKEAFDLIFAPGFSTKTDVSDVSGRGVGMDVVKTKITQLNGLLDIDSTLGEGTCLTIKVPLTLAIMPTLMVLLEQQAFALPLVSVNEIFQMDLTNTHVVDGQECVMIRDKPVPIFHLKRWLVSKPTESSDLSLCHVVIVSVGITRVGFVVDDLIGQEEVVIKPLGTMLQGTPGMAGATITGDGSIALILDVPGMLKQYAGTV